ncbi:MAG: DMT family transporter [Cyanobacteria bacterium P01_E01_bin.6]
MVAVSLTVAQKKVHRNGILLLLLTTIIFGTSFPVLKNTISSLSPSVLIAVRYSIAAIALLPWLRNLNRRLLRDGALLGFVLFLETACALTGLETISANRSAFIIGLNVILVPLLGVLLGHHVPKKVLFAAGLAVVGVSIMSGDGGGISSGDVLSLASALGIAIYIMLLEAIAPRHPSLPLASVQIWVMLMLGVAWALPDLLSQMAMIGDRLPALVYLGIVVTIGPLWGQAMGQRSVPAHEAALVYTLEPVFATVFSFWLLGEGLGIKGALGAVCILTATVVSQYQRRSKPVP